VVNCGWLQPQERTALVDLASHLDGVERLAARKAGVGYVSTLTALRGHELCTRDSWLFPIELRCANGDTSCGHPLPLGQVAIASAVRAALTGKSKPSTRHRNR
jgi:hypothetical protein